MTEAEKKFMEFYNRSSVLLRGMGVKADELGVKDFMGKKEREEVERKEKEEIEKKKRRAVALESLGKLMGEI